jgi:CBS domain containing-hemolysin-like protein
MAGLSGTSAPSCRQGGDYYSLGGFIVEQLGQVPRPGAVLSKLGFEFIVREADERHITQVEVIPGAMWRSATSSARADHGPPPDHGGA